MTGKLDRHYIDYDDDDEEGVEELNECPLCTEEFDVTDKNFKPCRCGYQICIWCWHKLMETAGGRCPNCRRIYDSNNLDFTPPDPTLIQTEKKNKTRKKHSFSRKQLGNVRVIQRNLVYVVGLTLDVAREDVMWLKRPDNFGKYGKIAKVVINKSNLTTGSRPPNVRSPTVSAYITFARKEDAYRCIKAIDSTWLDGKLLRASFGTTKYCAYFLRGIPCTNPDCMYLHDYGDEEDTFNKEDIVLRNGLPVPHNSDKLSQFYPHLEDPSPCEKHFWSFKDSNVPPPDSFEAAYDEDDIYHMRKSDDDQYDDIDVHDEDNYNEYDEQQWSSNSEDEIEEEPQHIPVTEYAKDVLDPNGSILPSTAKWGKKSPESKSKKKKKKNKATKQPAPAPVQPPPLDVNNAWSALGKAKATVTQTTPRSAGGNKTTTTTTTAPAIKPTTVTAKPVVEAVPQKPPVVVAPPVVVSAQPQAPSPIVAKAPEKVPEKKAQVLPLKEEKKEKPKQDKKQKKKEEEKETTLVQENGSNDEAILQEPTLPSELDLPLETETFFSEKDQIHTPQTFAPETNSIVPNAMPQPFVSGVDPLLSGSNAGLWGSALQAQQQQQQQQVPQKPQQFNNANNFVHSLMQFGLGSADLASQLQQQQYMQQFYQPPQMPGAVDLGDLPWETGNPFVEPTRTRSRFEFAQFGTSKTTAPFAGDAWKTPSTDQWGYPTNDLGYSSNDLQQSFRALLPNVNINFSSQGMGGAEPSAWGFNQPTTPTQGKTGQNGQNISINNNINNINININNHHHTPNYPNNYQYGMPANKDPNATTTTTTTSYSFGGNPFAGDSWGFNQTPAFSSLMPQDPIFSPAQPQQEVKEEPEKSKQSNTNAPSNTSNKKAKGKKGKK